MKQKIRIITVLFLICILLFVGIWIRKKLFLKKEPIVEKQPKQTYQEPVQWHGNYIWDETNQNNTWMCFRKKVNIDQDFDEIVAQIAVDSKYWLYINGQIVVREGALKRGETRNSIYYDELELSSYFQKGENTIAVLVWYWGDVSYSHNSSGQGAMLFQAKIGNSYLVSDESWKVAKNKAYLQDELRPNNRLIEYNVYYDATLSQEDWYQPNFDDTSWKNSKILGLAGDYPWGQMIQRNIPQFKNSEIKQYENLEKYQNNTTTQEEIVEMKIPYNAQFTPYLKIEAPAGQKITIKTDQYEDVCGDSVKCTYVTKQGIQEFESLAWMNGEKVYYQLPKDVKILDLGYRETGYNTEIAGDFICDNEFFNQLWKKAARTLYVNMRDSYMDCPNRERAQWWGDTSMSMLQAMYALDTKAHELYEKGVKTTIGWKDGDTLLTVVPITADYLHLPVQMLAGIRVDV